MIADAVAIHQLSVNGAHSLFVDSGAVVHVRPKSYAAHAPLRSLPECRRGLCLRSASGKMLKVLEYARGGLQRNGSAAERFFTVKIHLTNKDAIQKLGGHGREMNLRTQGNSDLVDVEFRDRLLQKKRKEMRVVEFPPGLVAPVDSGVARLSATAGVVERGAVTISTPEVPSREAVSRTS